MARPAGRRDRGYAPVVLVDLWFWRADPAGRRDADALRADLARAEVAPDPARPAGYQGFRLRGATPAGLAPFDPARLLLALDDAGAPRLELVASDAGVVWGMAGVERARAADLVRALTAAGLTVHDVQTGALHPASGP